MKLLEYQGKHLFERYGIPIPRGRVVDSEEEIKDIPLPCVIKAQVTIGGRGKAGLIKEARSEEEARRVATDLLGKRLKDIPVRKLLVEEKVEIDKEIYLSFSIDTSKRAYLLMASSLGGVDIESIPDEKIVKEWINPLIGLQPFNVRRVVERLNVAQRKEIYDIISGMYRIFKDYDCELVEINPLALTREGKLIALDSKIIVNDDALFRHPDLVEEDEGIDPIEREAKQKGIAFVRLDGNIGVIANGAGLTMATLDALKNYGGDAGVFLDLGGTDDVEKVKQAFQLMKKAKPKVILLNLFGGITKCDTVAKGVELVISEEGIECPIVARIKGVNEEEAREILKNAGIEAVENLHEAARLATEFAKR